MSNEHLDEKTLYKSLSKAFRKDNCEIYRNVYILLDGIRHEVDILVIYDGIAILMNINGKEKATNATIKESIKHNDEQDKKFLLAIHNAIAHGVKNNCYVYGDRNNKIYIDLSDIKLIIRVPLVYKHVKSTDGLIADGIINYEVQRKNEYYWLIHIQLTYISMIYIAEYCYDKGIHIDEFFKHIMTISSIDGYMRLNLDGFYLFKWLTRSEKGKSAIIFYDNKRNIIRINNGKLYIRNDSDKKVEIIADEQSIRAYIKKRLLAVHSEFYKVKLMVEAFRINLRGEALQKFNDALAKVNRYEYSAVIIHNNSIVSLPYSNGEKILHIE